MFIRVASGDSSKLMLLEACQLAIWGFPGHATTQPGADDHATTQWTAAEGALVVAGHWRGPL